MLESLPNPDREINSRDNDGITVRWLMRPDRTHYVTAEDRKLNTFDIVEVADSRNGSDVFDHPYSYIADIAIGTCPDFIPDIAA